MMMTRMKRKKKRKRTGISLRVLILALIASSVPFTSSGQQSSAGGDSSRLASTRSIEGRVLTASGAAVPGAVVLLKDGKTLQVRSYIAQKDGQYHFFGLSTDVNYTLRAENQGLSSKQKTVSVFDSHKKVKLDLKLLKKVQQAKK
jgi:Carboxypeptidase regulatory-like domain